MKEIADIIAESERRGDRPMALATLVRARGSSYRRPGARMLIASDGSTSGSLSGGCLEEEVAARAQEVIAGGNPLLLTFDTRLRYGCHGSIDIFIEKFPQAVFHAISSAQKARFITRVATTFANRDSLGTRLLEPGEEAPASDYVQTIPPPLRLILLGEGPDSVALRSFSRALGWQLLEAEEASALPNDFDQWTAAIVKTHNYGRDYAALVKLLPLGLRYLALLGPRRRRDQLLHALHDAGIEQSSELFAPAGLDLGAESPEEIALAMIAEIQAVFSGAGTESLRERKAAIHPLPAFAVA